MSRPFEKPWFNVYDLASRWDITVNEVLDFALERHFTFYVDIRKKTIAFPKNWLFRWESGSESLGNMMPVWESLLLRLYTPEFDNTRQGVLVTGGSVICPFSQKREYFTIETAETELKDDDLFNSTPGIYCYQSDLIIPSEDIVKFEHEREPSTSTTDNHELSPKVEEKYLKIIMGLTGLLKEQMTVQYSQNRVVDMMLEKYSDIEAFPGDTSIKQVLSKANKFRS